MNEGIHLDLDTWIVPGQIRKANLCRELGSRYPPAGTEVLISAIAHNSPYNHHHHQKAFRNKSHTSHGHRPGLKRKKSKGKRKRNKNKEKIAYNIRH